MSVYRENASSEARIDVGELHVCMYLTNGESFMNIRFKGELEKSTDLPNTHIITKVEHVFIRWIVAAREGGFYTFDDPQRASTDNGRPMMQFVIPYHAVVKLTTLKYKHDVEYGSGVVYDSFTHSQEVRKFMDSVRLATPPAPRK